MLLCCRTDANRLVFRFEQALSAGLVHLLVFVSCDYHLASDGASLAMSIHRQIDGPFQRSTGELFS